MPIRLNLLAEAQAVEEMRRRDPVKRAVWIAALIICLMLVWSSFLQLKTTLASSDLNRVENQMNARTNAYRQVLDEQRKNLELEQTVHQLRELSNSRFLYGSMLNALQHTIVDDVQLLRLRVDQAYSQTAAVKTTTNDYNVVSMGKPATATEHILLTLEASDSSPNPGDQVGKYKQALAANPYFQKMLDKTNALTLKNLSAPQWQRICDLCARMPVPGDNPMKLSKLPKEKRDQLILVVLLTVFSVAGLGFGLIKYQYQKLALLAAERQRAQIEFDQVQSAVKHADQIAVRLAESKKALASQEADIASGDLYSWVINTLRPFKSAYKVEVPQFGLFGAVSDVNLLPNFPYRQAALTVTGTAHYHDLGKFIADLENKFPHFRVLNLSLDLNAGPASEDRETLSFKLDLVTLVKPNTL